MSKQVPLFENNPLQDEIDRLRNEINRLIQENELLVAHSKAVNEENGTLRTWRSDHAMSLGMATFSSHRVTPKGVFIVSLVREGSITTFIDRETAEAWGFYDEDEDQ